MRPFALERAGSTEAALRMAAAVGPSTVADGRANSHYLAGGTTLLDLMKLDVLRPELLIDIAALRRDYGRIAFDASGLSLGGLVRMSEAADHPTIRAEYRVLSDALWQAVSPQLRNMASLAGNVLQRTRCNYFRNASWRSCNKRNPGSGCAAIDGVNRRLAVLGVSDHCIAHYPGDFAVAMAALGAQVELLDATGAASTMEFEALHRLPGDTPSIETNLQAGQLITGFRVPAGPWTKRSLYLKVRDRTAYDFALASAAVALDLETGGRIRVARVGIGGLATKPWRSHEAEAALVGRTLNDATARTAAEAAFAGAVTHGGNDFKPELGRRTLVRALLEAARMEA